MASQIQVQRTGATASLTLNRPEALNALSKSLVVELRGAVAALRGDGGVAALVIAGAGDKAFCAGADLKERVAMSLPQTREFLGEINALMNEIAAFPGATIAAVNGVAFGGGLELALACDIRMAAATASLGLLEVTLGIIPGAGGTQRLSRLCGLAVAKELILTGRRIDAERAQSLGLLSSVVPAGELRAEAERVAAEIGACGPLAIAQAKRALDVGFALPLAEGLAVEAACYEVVLSSADRNEGLRAFVEKRKPVFTGK